MNFNVAVMEVIKREGGDKLHNVSGDKGGLTKFGISQRAYPGLDIANLTLNEAIAIYKRDYWDKVGGDKIKYFSIASALFNQAVNRGVTTAIKMAQNAVGVKPDGLLGPGTLNALNLISESFFLEKFKNEVIKGYEAIVLGDPSQKKFLDGWKNRANLMVDYSMKYLGTVNGKITASVGVVLIVGIFFLIIFTKGKK